MIAWTILFLINALFWLWIVFWGGAEKLEGTLASGFLIDAFAPGWSYQGIKLFGWITLIGSTIWYVLGVFVPSLRLIL